MPVKTFIMERNQAGQTVAEVLQRLLKKSRGEVVQFLRLKKVHLAGHLCQTPGRRVRAGQRLEVMLPHVKKQKAPQTQPAAPKIQHPLAQAIRIRYLDPHIVVVDKPAGLTTVRHAAEAEEFGKRAKKYLPPTLVDLLPDVLPPAERHGRLRAVHRLDKETSGLVVLARTGAAETHLGKQFRAHSIEREYLALVRGRAQTQRIESHLVRDRGAGRRGSGSAEAGQHAVTHVEVLETLGQYTLIKCVLETGRTHQVRIHLGEQGTPLCGERIYDRPLHGKALPDGSGAARPLLHAAFLAIDHPQTGERLSWRSAPPKDMEQVIKKVRNNRSRKP